MSNMVFETFKITVAINQLNSQNFQPYCISEMQTLWGETEQVLTKNRMAGYHFNMLNSTELLTGGDN